MSTPGSESTKDAKSPKEKKKRKQAPVLKYIIPIVQDLPDFWRMKSKDEKKL